MLTFLTSFLLLDCLTLKIVAMFSKNQLNGEHYTLDMFGWSAEEFAASRVARAKKIKNVIPAEMLKDLEFFNSVVFVLFKECKLQLTSGYRCYELNKAVGGVSKSKHLFCRAGDFVGARRNLQKFAYELSQNNKTDELIYNPIKNYIHVATIPFCSPLSYEETHPKHFKLYNLFDNI